MKWYPQSTSRLGFINPGLTLHVVQYTFTNGSPWVIGWTQSQGSARADRSPRGGPL
jgi:hypothetical protein